VSLHLLLNDETRDFLSHAHIAHMCKHALLINTARGVVLEEDALVDALASGHLGGAALGIFVTEALPSGHAPTKLSDLMLSTHSAFRMPEATNHVIRGSSEHCRRIVQWCE
jgi:D-3-phosphoglycerate dehydrogenase